MFHFLFRPHGAPQGQPEGEDCMHQRKARGRAASHSPSRRRGNRPALENLEERTLLSANNYPAVHLLQAAGFHPAAVQPMAALPAGLSPAQVRHAYGFDQITFSNGNIQGDGTGQTIAIIDAYDQPNIASDLAAFDSTFGIAAPPSFTKVNENGGSTLPAASASWGLEISLDVEWAHAIAPGARILLVEASSSSDGDLDAAVDYARKQPGVSVVSMSYGGAEYSGETSEDTYYTTPSGHAGVTFVASTGDSGSAGAPNAPSVSPNVLAVGGTQLSVDGSGNYLGETGWSGSGGGISVYESQPSYQKGVVTQSTTKRTVPDVAYNGSSGSAFAIYDTDYGGWVQVYGTSAGAPQWAALVAIANQGRALAGQGALDGPSQTLPDLYQLPSADFHDITSGSNGGYSAGPGYDLVTGRGTPLANLVVSGLVGSSNPPPGQPPVVVTPASATPTPVTGTTTQLSVAANDPAGLALTYTWSVVAAPAGAPAVGFSANGTAAAKNSTATFHLAGAYTFQVTVTNTSGLSATSSVSVTVNQTLAGMTVTPGKATLGDGGKQQFTASAVDQFGSAMAAQPTWSWSLAAGGLGTVSSTGMYTAPSTGSGTVTVQVSGGGLSGTASVTVGSAPAAPSNLVARLISSRQVGLTWTDNSNNETGFVIQRSTNGGAWTQIATVGANVTSYTDSAVSRRKKYTYRIYAYNSFGNSAFSNVTAGVTPNTGTVIPRGRIVIGSSAGVVSVLTTLTGPGKAGTVQGTVTGFGLRSFDATRRQDAGSSGATALTTQGGRTTHSGPASADAIWLVWGANPEQDLFRAMSH
jgi:hypothetical protein